MPKVGIEPTCPKAHEFESCASANSATSASELYFNQSLGTGQAIDSEFVDGLLKNSKKALHILIKSNFALCVYDRLLGIIKAKTAIPLIDPNGRALSGVCYGIRHYRVTAIRQNNII